MLSARLRLVEKAMKKGQSLFKLQPFIFKRNQLFMNSLPL
jgi:hypothetical protein